MKAFYILILLVFSCFAAKSFEAEVILKETKIVLSGGKKIIEERHIIQINNRSGEKYTKIAIPYSRIDKLLEINAVITDANGKVIRKLKKNDITDRSHYSEAAFYQDIRLKEFTLKHNVYPYRIDYTFRKRSSQFLDLAHWHPVLSPDIPCHSARLHVSIPNNTKVKFFVRDVDDYKVSQENYLTTHVWSSHYSIPLKNQVFAPPLRELIPFVRITPEIFRYGISGSSNTWTEFGDWVYKLNKGVYDLSIPYQRKILSMIENSETSIDKINILYRHLQTTTRYINVSIGTGGLKSYPASYVARNRYGDCKALSVYMKALLDVAGIQSYLALIYADDNPIRINHDFPSQQFNHVILMVPIENDTIWLECTGKGPVGYLGSFTQGREALVIDKSRSFWAKTPVLSKNDVLYDRFLTISKKTNFNTDAVVAIRNKGDKYDLFQYIMNNFNKNEIDQIVKENFSIPDFSIDEYYIEQAHADEAEILLSLKASSGTHIRKLGDNLLINSAPFHIPSFEAPAVRTLPVRINYPIYQNDIIVYKLGNVQPDISKLNAGYWESSFGRYEINFQKTDDGFIASKSFILFAGEYTLDEYPDFYEFIQRIRNQNTSGIVFN